MEKVDVKFNGQKLKAKRNGLNKSRVEMAKFLDITPQSYGEMENGSIKPNSVNLAKLCLLFNCPAEDFFDVSEKFLALI